MCFCVCGRQRPRQTPPTEAPGLKTPVLMVWGDLGDLRSLAYICGLVLPVSFLHPVQLVSVWFHAVHLFVSEPKQADLVLASETE